MPGKQAIQKEKHYHLPGLRVQALIVLRQTVARAIWQFLLQINKADQPGV